MITLGGTQPRGIEIGLLNNFFDNKIQLCNVLHNICAQTNETRFFTNCLKWTSACQDIATLKKVGKNRFASLGEGY